MKHHWVSNNVKQSGYDDMVLLPKIAEQAIFDNLKKRFLDNFIYTYIGPVLISVNPYKELPYFTDSEIEQYRGATQIENPPHIYAVADFMYRNMLIDNENQCVIISGESGAGKTVCAKYIMNYITKVSGGNQSAKVQNIKNVILQSNPLLEAFGNAKTLRNNNSSRFGKYVEIQFNRSGEPDGGKITNFLLEKSRVVGQMKNERNFHIFYQLCSAKNDELHKNLGIQSAARFNYLSRSECFDVDGVDDYKEFHDVLNAMKIIRIGEAQIQSILRIIAGILHLGNVGFVANNNYAQVDNEKFLEYPSHLLGVDKNMLKTKLTSRIIETKAGSVQEKIDVMLNVEQAEYTRDALAKGIYARLFDHLVSVINEAMVTRNTNILNIGILDIYGFEIFDQNGFEQFCINYVNEKLQQIFIELTLKAEQEEYRREGIKWNDIDYFDNKVVCDLIESKVNPLGMFSIFDDVVITNHGTGEGVDYQLLQKLQKSFATHPHFKNTTDSFQIKHYAGAVDYNINGFCEKNRDVLFQDLIDLMKSSQDAFISGLFPDQPVGAGKRPTTAGTKIKSQANQLVEKLMKCYPSYIRCIKPNENKQPREMDDTRVKHQIKYLGLVENVRVRRAGFAYRREFAKFIQRYGIVAKETRFWNGPVDQGIRIIMNAVNMDPNEWQTGKSKVFIKSPESLFLLEEIRDRRYNEYAIVLQKAFRKFNAIQYYLKLKNEASDILYGKKERRPMSLNRKFYGDYIGLDNNPRLRMLLPKRENVEFAQTCTKYDRMFKKQKRDLILTNKAVYIVGREEQKEANNKQKKIVEVIKRRLELLQIQKIVLTKFSDNYLVIYPKPSGKSNDDYATVIELEFKTEFLTTLTKRFKEAHGGNIPIEFANDIQYTVKKEGILGGLRGNATSLKFIKDANIKEPLVNSKLTGKSCVVRLPADGLPDTSRPTANYYQNYNFEREPWWPKFDALRSKYGIKIVKGDNKYQNQTRAKASHVSRNENYNRMAPQQAPTQPILYQNQEHVEQSAPASYENMAPERNEQSQMLAGILQGQSMLKKTQPNGTNASAAPPARPPVKQRKPMKELAYPKAKALYPYTAADADELSFEADDIIYIVKEDPSGWWSGICNGKTGLLPSNYIEKL